MRVPIACSLDVTDARTQIGEWRAVLAAAVVQTERPDRVSVRMRLSNEGGAIETIVSLAQREVACCPFFRFTLEIDSDGTALCVSVPPEAAEILDAFVTLAPG